MHILRLSLRIIFTSIALLVAIFILVHIFTTPSNNRDWVEEQALLSYAEITDNTVTVHNIRNFSYGSTTASGYYDRVFNLNEIKQVWFIVSPFSGIPGSAHTFLSFEFEGDQFLSISVEVRKEKGEAFHPIKGLFNNYEIIYVIADERDVIQLRSNVWKDQVYVYPIKTTQEKVRSLFLSMIHTANDLYKHPQFYNTITNSCTSNIVKHVNIIAPHRVPFFNLKILLPANSDVLAYTLGLIDTDLSFEEARAHYHINDRALQYADDPDFSKRIRE